MTEKVYQFNLTRLLSLWLLPTFFGLFILFSISTKFDRTIDLNLVDIIAWTSFSIFAVGIFIFLFFNHLSLAQQTKIFLFDKNFKITQGDKIFSANYTDITDIIEYSSKKLPWGYIIKWIIKINNDEIVISSLTISQHDFERHFWNRINHCICLIPTI